MTALKRAILVVLDGVGVGANPDAHVFPPEVVEPFEKAIGRKVIWNRATSGTEIIKELGEEHIRTGRPILYTSADSVFQIAAHQDVIPLTELYHMCEIARHM